MIRVRFIISAFLLLPLCLAVTAGAVTREEFHAALENHLSCFPLELVSLDRQEISIIDEDLCLAGVYKATGMKALWTSENGPGAKAAILLQYLENSANEGLRPDDYHVAEIQSLWQSGNPDHLARLDTRLTLGLIKYAHDVSHGRITPFKTDPKLFAEAGDSHFKPALIVEQALAAQDLSGYLDSLPPSHEHYKRLRDAMLFYRSVARTGSWDWKEIAAGTTLHPGDRDERVRQVRRRLVEPNRPLAIPADEALYDEELVPAVKKFQKQFGLEEDGLIGRKTLAALNTSPEDIVKRIILNMTRWRWQEHELGRRHIMVNIANFDLRAVNDGREELNMAVIVGKFQHQTPVFSHRVQYVDFNPFWNIPPSIARNEELPELRKDPHYLINRNVRLFSGWDTDAVELDSTGIDWQSVTPREMNRYKLRQDPGPWNALGPVKLVFPNRYNVYIHGTPAQELFEHNVRSFSHGCIRASNPLGLVHFALSEEKEEWSLADIQEIIDTGERKVVIVKAPLPVHVTYQTVWVDNEGIIHFNDDIYGRDRKLAEVLFAARKDTAGSMKNLSVND